MKLAKKNLDKLPTKGYSVLDGAKDDQTAIDNWTEATA